MTKIWSIKSNRKNYYIMKIKQIKRYNRWELKFLFGAHG